MLQVRLAWHDAGTYDKDSKTGGPNASIRFKQESDHAANAGLVWAVNQMRPFKKQFPDVSNADLYQLAGVVAIEHAGGPKIPFRFGRKDVEESECPEEGRLPDANKVCVCVHVCVCLCLSVHPCVCECPCLWQRHGEPFSHLVPFPFLP